MTRFRRFLAAETAATGLPIPALLIAAIGLHVAVAVLAAKPWHPDEHFQILEVAWARAGLASTADLPWEFAARIRGSLQPAIAMTVLGALRALGVTSPYPWILLLRLGTLAAALSVVLRVIALASPSLSVRARRALWLTGLTFWVSPFLVSRYTAENVSGLLLALAVTFVAIPGEARARDDRGLIVAAGLALLCRPQMAFGLAALLGWMLRYNEGGARRVSRVVAGIGGALLFGAVLDRWFYGAWVFTPWEYVRVNLVEGVAATFGTAPWYAYLVWVPAWMVPPLGVVVFALMLGGAAARRDSPWSWAFAGFLVGHFAVAHKELRFLFPLLYFVPPLVAFGVDAFERGARRAWWRVATAGVVVQNCVMAGLLLTPSIHRGKEFDWHYFRFLWTTAASAPGDLVVLNGEANGDPYRVWNWSANVFRHPSVRGVVYSEGDSLPRSARQDPAARVLLMTRAAHPPPVPGADVTLLYADESGYRTMARWAGLESSRALVWLEDVDRWTISQWKRRVYRVVAR